MVAGLVDVGFVAGIPGQSYSYNYSWTNFENSGGTCPESTGNYVIWCSNDAYSDPNGINPNFSWIEYGDTLSLIHISEPTRPY